MAAAPLAVPIAAAALGTAAVARGEHVQATQRRDKLNEALMRTDKTQKDTNNRVLNEADSLSPLARAATMQAQATTNAEASKSDLASAGATDAQGNAIIDTSGDNGAVSKDFLTSKADRALSEGTRLTSIAQQLAKVRAPGQVQQQEGERRADLTQSLGSMWGSTKAANDADQLDAQGIQTPGYAKIGRLAQMAALAYLTAGGGAAAGGAGAGAGGTIWAGGDGAAAGAGAFA